MDQDESVAPQTGSAPHGQREAVPGTVDGVELAEQSSDGLSFGSLANPKRLRLGVSRSL
ncbi:hypothetical protein Ga0074812_10179 [Parafrankia irregularis]|uniref:Uncharacterized protein n=1 Tax=Parafrankia irregularis TaxID=795642 RepID=A0A0S4QDI5_9ACTN|nr:MULTISPECIES: hypothetical protein [Frankiaceae]MBE3199746.1 hypothetical protein [Parafrankia sp. CH37]CUU53581.1 hypothetical protein Ga0074812_10179 [Parafrankia irregularis]